MPTDSSGNRKSESQIDTELFRIISNTFKDAQLGLVIGQVGDEPSIFIDEILPDGMIDMHGQHDLCLFEIE